IQLENAVSTISQEYLLEFTSEYGIPESLHPELPGPDDPIVEFPMTKSVFTPSFLSLQTFADEDPPLVITKMGDEATAKAILELGPKKEAAAMGPFVNKRRCKRRNEGAEANAPPKVLRNDHVAS
nr:hypothetical protein [Tanacetum cinerariifolium]